MSKQEMNGAAVYDLLRALARVEGKLDVLLHLKLTHEPASRWLQRMPLAAAGRYILGLLLLAAAATGRMDPHTAGNFARGLFQ